MTKKVKTISFSRKWISHLWWNHQSLDSPQSFTNITHTLGKRKIYSLLSGKKFRQVKCLVISLVKSLLSRNFCQISAIVNFEKFPQSARTVLLDSVKLIFGNVWFLNFFHKKICIFICQCTQCGKTRNYLHSSHWKKISSNQLFSDFFSKTIAFTKFLRKKSEREFLQFPQYVIKVKTLILRNWIAVQQTNRDAKISWKCFSVMYLVII